jgi:hypothetical protein
MDPTMVVGVTIYKPNGDVDESCGGNVVADVTDVEAGCTEIGFDIEKGRRVYVKIDVAKLVALSIAWGK